LLPVETIDAICRFLAEGLVNIRPEEKTITVYPYSLPDPDPAQMMEGGSGNPATYEGMMPAVIVTPIAFEDSDFEDGWSYLTVSLLVGTYSLNCVDGPWTIMNILERIRRLLLTNRILEDSCEVQQPLKWQMYDDGTKPLWFGEMITQWRIVVPERADFSKDFGAHGENSEDLIAF
jgi:hypothetical protein